MGTPTHVPSSRPEPDLSSETVTMYLAACEEKGRNEPAPNPEDYLANLDERDRSRLRKELEAIRDKHEQSRSGNGSKIIESPETITSAAADTKRGTHNPPQDFTGSKGLDDKGASPGDTVDQLGLAQSNNDYFSVSEETGELANALEETGELPSASEYTGAFSPSTDLESVGDANRMTGSLPDASDYTSAHTPRENETGDYTPQEAQQGAPSPKPKKGVIPLPSSVAGYEILQVLGRGAMGVVYKARQRGLKRLVALKMILSGEHASAQDLGRFQSEANAVAQLQHPGIVQIYEIGEDNGRPFFSLEFVDGVSLHKRLQGNPLPGKEAAGLMQKMAGAMYYAHQRGVIHRDLKPANILLTSDGIPKIGDFGLAKRLEDDESGLTRTGSVLGTPSYMSPEQAAGLNDEVGPLADVYSLGAILYDMLTGRPPFRGTSIMDTLQQLRTREPVPPMELQPGVPRDLETICLKCLEKDRFKRYADAGALAADLQRYLDGKPILARPISKIEKAWRWSMRNKKDASYIATAILVPIVFTVLMVFMNQQLDEQRTAALTAQQEEKAAKEREIVQKNFALEQEKLAKEQKELAEANEKKAIENEKLAKENEKLAKEKEKLAELQMEAQRGTAEQSVRGMVAMVQKVYSLLQSKKRSVAAGPEAQKLRNEVLQDLRQSLLEIVSKINQKATVTYADLYALQLLGDLLMRFGQVDEPRELLTKALKIAQDRVQREPENDQTRANLGIIEEKLGSLSLDIEWDGRSALEHFFAARKLHETIRSNPISKHFSVIDIQRIVGVDDLKVGRAFLALGRAAEARTYFEEALDYFTQWNADEVKSQKVRDPRKYFDPRNRMMEATMYLGIAASNRGDYEAGEKYFKDALGLGDALMKEYTEILEYLSDQAEVEGGYGDLLMRQGKAEAAKIHYLKAASYLNRWMAKNPDDASKQALLALTQERLGAVSLQLNDKEEAKKYFNDASQLRRELYLVETRNLARMTAFVVAMARAGDHVNALRNCVSIRPRMVKSTELMLQVARCFAICARDTEKDREKNIEQALSALEVAIGTDFRDAELLLTDLDLAILRDQPAFQKLIDRINKQKAGNG